MPFSNNIKSHFAVVVNEKGNTAELKMYGNIMKNRSKDWWSDGKPVDDEGDYIIGSEVIKKLDEIGKCKKLNIRLNSVGGDVREAILIHNRLREMAVKNSTKIACSVDGVAMSAGSMIMCAADKVTVTSSSLVMVHRSLSFLLGWYNEDMLTAAIEESRQYDRVIAAAYRRKTGKSEKELLDMMSAETYMTGEEAVDKGFADELLEGESNLSIAACADRNALKINGEYFPLMGLKCPDNIPLEITAIEPEQSEGEGVAINNKSKNNKEVKIVAKNLTELRAEDPELAKAVEDEIRTACLQQGKTAAEEAVQKAAKEAVETERKRLAEIDEIAPLFGADLVNDAKFGDNPCTAAELAYRAAKADVKKGADYLEKMKKDTVESNVEKVTSAALPDDSIGESEKAAAAGKSAAAAYLKTKKGAKE